MPYTRESPNFTPLKTHQFEIDTHMKLNPVTLALTVVLTLGVVYWLHPLPVSAVIIIGLLAYGVSLGLTFFISKLF